MEQENELDIHKIFVKVHLWAWDVDNVSEIQKNRD